MRISWKWLSELVNLKSFESPEALAELLTRRGLEVESVERQGAGLEKVVTVEILERNPHPQADRLSLCKVTTGAGEPLEIVCGAQNMKAGDRVALAQIGASLPNGLKIQLSKIRGVVSNGMLCSEDELKLSKPGEKSEGILILPSGTPLGRPLAEILGLDDTILVFKLTANRGDCLSHWGMAREVAAALGQKPCRPEAKPLGESNLPASPIAIELQAGESAPQFFGCFIEGVKVGPSPAWVAKRLEALGSRSISNVVDATNLLMLELGQPVHAYDADRIAGKRIVVRRARDRETLPLLDGTTVTLNGSELVIADGERAVGLAGVMGGGNSEVSATTTRVFLECAEFDPSLVRRASSRHARKTDAAHRFERGIDPAGLPHAISRLANLVVELAGGRIAGYSARREASRSDEALARGRSIRVNVGYFARFLGMDVSAEQAEKILRDLSCDVVKNGEEWTVRVPSFRLDLNLPQDLAEEIARSIGYDQIAETVPSLSTPPTAQAEQKLAVNFHLVEKAKNALVQSGLNETVNFAFTSRARLSRFGMVSTATVINPLSEDLEALVPSLLPGLVQNSLDNCNHHFGSEALAIRLFELRPTFYSADAIAARGEMETGVEERWKLAIALSGPRFASALRNELGEVDFYDLRGVIESLVDALGIRGVRYQPLHASRGGGHPLFHPGQSVEVLAGKGDVVGVFGLLHPGKALELKTRAPLWLAELNWDALAKLARPAGEGRAFKPWGEFPAIERDFALLVKSDVTVEKVTQVALKAGKPLARTARIFDVYRGNQVAAGMTSVAVRVTFVDDTRSLQESEAETASAAILAAWKNELGVELRG